VFDLSFEKPVKFGSLYHSFLLRVNTGASIMLW